MRIGEHVIDTMWMSCEDIDVVIRELRQIRARKSGARECLLRLKNVAKEAKDNGFVFCDKYTGEIFNASNYDVYDEVQECIHGSEVE